VKICSAVLVGGKKFKIKVADFNLILHLISETTESSPIDGENDGTSCFLSS
jgi:hypothetical protein